MALARVVGSLGLEPRTLGLKGPCSTIELRTQIQVDCAVISRIMQAFQSLQAIPPYQRASSPTF